MTNETGGGEGEKVTLEGRLRRLEEIVGQLETEDLELDRALAIFEEGVVHVREAERALAAAELRVEELLGDGDTTEHPPPRSGGRVTQVPVPRLT